MQFWLTKTRALKIMGSKQIFTYEKAINKHRKLKDHNMKITLDNKTKNMQYKKKLKQLEQNNINN